MKIAFLIFYIVIFNFLIIDFIKFLKNKEKLSKLLIFEISIIILSLILTTVFNNLPGKGFMPGLTYIGEFLVNFGAAILSSCLLVITLIIKIIKVIIKSKKIIKNSN